MDMIDEVTQRLEQIDAKRERLTKAIGKMLSAENFLSKAVREFDEYNQQAVHGKLTSAQEDEELDRLLAKLPGQIKWARTILAGLSADLQPGGSLSEEPKDE